MPRLKVSLSNCNSPIWDRYRTDMARPPRRVLLGQFGAAHGIRGDVNVCTFTEMPENIASYGPLQDESGKRTFTLQAVRVTSKGLVVRVTGVSDRTAAEKLNGVKLYVDRDRLPAATEGEYYHDDLIGLKAVSPEGSLVGRIRGVHNFGAGDLIEIAVEGSKATEFIPFSDAFVPEVDIERGLAVVIMPALVETDESGTPDADNDGG